LDPDDKTACKARGEVDLYVAFGNGLPTDLDMGVPTDTNKDSSDCEKCDKEQLGLMSNGTALKASLTFEYKDSAYPDIGDENINDIYGGTNRTADESEVDSGHGRTLTYWQPIKCAISYHHNTDDTCTYTYGEGGLCVVYDAATKRFSAVWHTVADHILNGYYDIRVRVVDEAGNVAYKVIAEKVIVDNTPPDTMITNINGDTTLTYVDQGGLATDTELPHW
jgi:hypothetical protein